MIGANYENPNLFDGFRFSRLREQPAEGAATFNRHVVSTATDFVPFGHGPHACPGRYVPFLPSNVLYWY